MNDETAAECSECGLSLRASRSDASIDALLHEFMEGPEAAKPAPKPEESLDLDKEIVDDLLDSLVVKEVPEQFECPLCGTPLEVDAERCPKCGAAFAEEPVAPIPGTEAIAVPPGPLSQPETVPERPKVAARVTESEGRPLRGTSARLVDFTVAGTVAGLAGVFLGFRMYSSTYVTPLSLALFLAVGAAGFAVGSLLFQVSTSSIAHGDRLVKQGRYEEAIRMYDRAIRTGYRPGNAWTSKGVALKRLERFENAMRCQKTALQLDEKNEIAWCNLGDLHFHLEQLDDAIASYDKAIAARPRYAIAWNNKGATLARAGRFQEARRCHDKAVTLQPKYRAAWLNRGEVLARLGFVDEARRCLEQARALAG